MRTAEGMVLSVADGSATVEFSIREGGCGRCHETGGCGGANLARAGCSRTRHVVVTNVLGAVVGQRVVVGVDDRTVSRFATAAYLRPVALFVIGAGIGQALSGSTGAALGGFFGLGVAFWLLKRWPATQSMHMVSLVR